MIYELVFNMERIDKSIQDGTNTIYAEESNLDEVEALDIKKGFFRHVITNGEKINEWPNIEFYYSSKASELESEYLLNSWRWPIVHKKVRNEFNNRDIKGIQYLPIKLIDVVTNEENKNYVVMNILNHIEAIDMDKSDYTYNEKYDLYSFIPHTTYLNKDVCSNYDIFRASKRSSVIYVSQKIKDIVEEKNWIGFEFYK